MPIYLGLLRKEPKRDFAVSFPDFPGCEATAPSLETAHTLATEVLEFHVESLREQGKPLPSPSDLERIRALPENRGAMAFRVEIRDG
jgi:predicted RNase H-like HicB family nuclease